MKTKVLQVLAYVMGIVPLLHVYNTTCGTSSSILFGHITSWNLEPLDLSLEIPFKFLLLSPQEITSRTPYFFLS